MICKNCGKEGHVYKFCKEPIISIGIILFKIMNNDIKFLCIQRKHSLNFVEFIGGKYDVFNIDYMYHIFNNMTKNEKKKILECKDNFDKLWNDFWNDYFLYIKKSRFMKKYDESKNKFEKLKNGFHSYNKYISLDLLIKKSTSFTEPEWEFPKGRRNLGESNIEVAKREFMEETNMNINDFSIVYDKKPISEQYIASNDNFYRNIYYIAKSKKNNYIPYIDILNNDQSSEIRDIRWFKYKDIYYLLRDSQTEKKKILTHVYKYIREHFQK